MAPGERPTPNGISATMRLFVLARDGDACRLCGMSPGDADPYDRRRNVRIGVERIREAPCGGDDADGIWTLCDNCSEGLRGIGPLTPPHRGELMRQLRRATQDDQRHALAWLGQKFGRVPRIGTTDAHAELAVRLYDRLLAERSWGLDRAWLAIASLLMTCGIWRDGEWRAFHGAPVLRESSNYRLTRRGEPSRALEEALRVKRRLADELGVGEADVCGALGRFFRHPEIAGLQPNNPRGHAFRSLVAETLARFGDPELVVREEVSPRDLFPDHEPGAPRGDARIDIVVQRGPRLVALIATRWSYRDGRGIVGGLRAHAPPARRLNGECRFFGVTAEFGAARLRKVIGQTTPAVRSAAIDRLAHLRPELPGAPAGRNGELGRMWSLEELVRDSPRWR